MDQNAHINGTEAGDDEKVADFVVRWEGSRAAVLAYVMAAFVNYHDAQDVLQDTAMVAGRNIAYWTGKSFHYDPVAHQITNNDEAVALLRRHRRDPYGMISI